MGVRKSPEDIKRRQKRRHPDFYSEIWVLVRFYQIRFRIVDGKTPSIRRVCEQLVTDGGFVAVVGGNAEALAKANAQREKKWLRFEMDAGGSVATPNSVGTVFADYSITNAGTLRARYNEANQIANLDRQAWLFWRNICRRRLGYPEKVPPRSRAIGSARNLISP
jgi:hypothetical protein